MEKNRYTEEQIIEILKQHEAGVKTADLCREHEISAATFYGRKSKFCGMDVTFHGRLRDECLNARWFRTLNDVRVTLAGWRLEYNCERAHIRIAPVATRISRS